MAVPTRIRGLALSIIAVGAAGMSLLFEEARWEGPTIAMADVGYVAWPVVRIGLLVAAITVALRHTALPHALIIRPLTAVLITLTTLQALHGRDWILVDIALLIATFALLWRAYFQINRNREHVGRLTQLLVVTPIGVTAGWVTVLVFSAIGTGIWSFEDLRTGVIATAWQAVLLVVALLFMGFGIEQTRAHPSYAVGALWAQMAIIFGAADQEDTTLMVIGLVVALITVALFFIERAMFTFRGRPAQPVDH